MVGALAVLAGIAPEDVAGYDLITCDTQPPRRFGIADDAVRLTTARQPHLGARRPAGHGGARARRRDRRARGLRPRGGGSESRSGAAGPLLADVLERVTAALGGGRTSSRRAIAALLVHVRRCGTRGAPEPAGEARPGQPAGRGRWPAAEDQRGAAVHDGRRRGGAVEAGLPHRRRAVAGVRVEQRRARAARRSGRSPRPGSASARSTSAPRCCRCTPPASCATSTTRAASRTRPASSSPPAE